MRGRQGGLIGGAGGPGPAVQPGDTFATLLFSVQLCSGRRCALIGGDSSPTCAGQQLFLHKVHTPGQLVHRPHRAATLGSKEAAPGQVPMSAQAGPAVRLDSKQRSSFGLPAGLLHP